MAKLVLSPEMQAKVDEYIRAAEPERVARLRADAQRDPGELMIEVARLSKILTGLRDSLEQPA